LSEKALSFFSFKNTILDYLLQFSHCVTLGALTSSIISRNRIRIGMAHQFLHRGLIHAGVKQITSEGAA
jgi:hypothetical protein